MAPALTADRPARDAALAKSAQIAARPIFFGPSRELFAFYHAPLEQLRSGAIVFCSPHGCWDFEATYRAYGDLAERLALAGFPVLRFHYHGTGNSSGADHDPDRLPAWRESLVHAVAELRRRTGLRAVSLFGMRLGGLIAALAAPEIEDLAAMVLWAPTLAGKAYVRELKAMRLINPTESILAGKVEGGEEAGGFMLSAGTIAALNAVKLLEVPGSARSATSCSAATTCRVAMSLGWRGSAPAAPRFSRPRSLGIKR